MHIQTRSDPSRGRALPVERLESRCLLSAAPVAIDGAYTGTERAVLIVGHSRTHSTGTASLTLTSTDGTVSGDLVDAQGTWAVSGQLRGRRLLASLSDGAEQGSLTGTFQVAAGQVTARIKELTPTGTVTGSLSVVRPFQVSASYKGSSQGMILGDADTTMPGGGPVVLQITTDGSQVSGSLIFDGDPITVTGTEVGHQITGSLTQYPQSPGEFYGSISCTVTATHAFGRFAYFMLAGGYRGGFSSHLVRSA